MTFQELMMKSLTDLLEEEEILMALLQILSKSVYQKVAFNYGE